MYKYVLIILTVVLFTTSCTNKNINAISNYEQQVSKNVKLDLKFKCKELVKISEVTTLDSMRILGKYLTDSVKISIDSLDYYLLKIDTIKISVNNLIRRYAFANDIYMVTIFKDNLNHFTNIEKVIKNCIRLREIKDTLLYTKFKCVYTILNPVTGINQEIIKFYFIKNNKIINTSQI